MSLPNLRELALIYFVGLSDRFPLSVKMLFCLRFFKNINFVRDQSKSYSVVSFEVKFDLS